MNAFEKIIGYEDIKEELYRVCDILKNPKKYRKFGVVPPRGILLYGEPGSGKTMMANAIISESGRMAFTLRKDGMNGNFGSQIRKVFDDAKEVAPSIVFLDDMDKYANEDEFHLDADEYVVIQSCIDECKLEDVFVIGTVNCRYQLPDSLIRAGRFDNSIEVKAPTGRDAVKIVEYYLNQKKNVDKNVDAEEIARLIGGCSCAEFETVINEAGIYAAYQQKNKIEQEDIIKACMRKIYDSPECISYKENSSLVNVALHEAGHTVIAELLNPGSVNLVSICRHTGTTKGAISLKKPDDFNLSRKQMENRVIELLGGKAATEIIHGVVDTGCVEDLDKAYIQVTRFVKRLCNYGFDTLESHNPSKQKLDKTDYLVAYEMERYYQEAKRLLVENRDFLESVTDELLKNEWLTYKDIAKIKRDCAML